MKVYLFGILGLIIAQNGYSQKTIGIKVHAQDVAVIAYLDNTVLPVNNKKVNPKITGLDCSNAYFNPPIFKQGQPYNGVMVVPYFGGNGSSYSAGMLINSVGNTGLQATLKEGVLKQGDGELTYSISGTPSKSSPKAAIFNLPALLGANGCMVSLMSSVK